MPLLDPLRGLTDFRDQSWELHIKRYDVCQLNSKYPFAQKYIELKAFKSFKQLFNIKESFSIESSNIKEDL